MKPEYEQYEKLEILLLNEPVEEEKAKLKSQMAELEKKYPHLKKIKEYTRD